MASIWTLRGAFHMLGGWFRGIALVGGGYQMALVTGTPPPDKNSTTLAALGTQIPVANGYDDGGLAVNADVTDFDQHVEADTSYVRIKDLVWTAVIGSLPSTGDPIRWGVLTDRNGTVGSREIHQVFDLGADRTVSVGQDLRLIDCQIDGVHVP